MSLNTTYPGVYIQELPSGVHTIMGVSTSITAFVGEAKMGPVNKPTLISSFADFERIFGGLVTGYNLGYAVNQYFTNGGQTAIIVRVVGSPPGSPPVPAQFQITDAAGNVLVLDAYSPGTWANIVTNKGAVTTFTDKGLANKTTYYYQIAAVNSSGESGESSEINATPSTPSAPSAPQNLVAIGGYSQVTLSWTTPSSNGGTPITQYNIYRDTTQAAVQASGEKVFDNVNGSATSYTDKNAANGTQYFYLVTAVNSAGESSDSNVQSATPSATLTVPTNLIATAGNSQVTLSWTAPSSNGGSSVLYYVIYRSIKSGAELAFTQTGAVTGGLNIRADNNSSDPTKLFNLTITNATSGTQEIFRNLSVNQTDSNYVSTVLKNSSNLVSFNTSSNLQTDLQFASTSAPFTPIIATPTTPGVDLPAGDSDVLGDQNLKTGIYALKKSSFNLLCIPPYGIDATTKLPRTDINYSSILEPAVTYCNENRAVFIVDSPTAWESDSVLPSSITFPDTSNGIAAPTYGENAVLFYPRVKMTDPLSGQLSEFAPCGMIAGAIANTDGRRGVWKAPAGIDTILGGVISLSVSLTDADNGWLNPQGINCLRTFPAIGSVIWGSRTLKGADSLENQWKYLPIRRLALYIEESLFRGTQWVVFEPNDEPLWSQIRLNIGAFMQDLFRKGAFQGSTPSSAYFVKCDSTTTTQDDIDRGIVNIVVGFAPLYPAEFVVIKIQQIAGQGAAS